MEIDTITQKKIILDQVQRLASQTLMGNIATALNSTILAAVLQAVLPRPKVFTWLFISLSVCLARILVHLYLQRHPVHAGHAVRRKRIYLFMLALSGCIWGSLPIFLFPYSSVAHQVLIVLVLAGMVAGSVGTFASIMGVFYAYSVPTLLPLIFVLFTIPDAIHLSMGVMTCLFALFMFTAARRLNREIYRFLVVGYENIALITHLETENRERQHAEEALRRKNLQIESIVAERTAELSAVNEKLRSEIDDRIEAEKERKELEAQLQRAQKMEMLGTMAGGVAHDLNNILSGIVGYPDLLLMQLPQDSAMRQPIEVMQDSGKKAAAIVQDLLALTRRGVLVEEVLNLNDVVAEYIDSPEHNKLVSFHNGISIEVSLENELPDISGSRIHLTKTVMNLVSNAVEAIPEAGRIEIRTTSRYLDRPIRGYDDIRSGDYAVLMVADTGMGIAAEDIDRIFEPFFTKKKMGRSGTGLGMAVVWGTVKDHHGYIDVESTVGQGSRLMLYFPITRKARQAKENQAPISRYRGRGETILLVDDMREQRQIASDMLEQLGYRVNVSASGEAAVAWLGENSVDLIVLDMIMDPGMDGLDTFKAILDLHPGQKTIIASGFSETDRVREAMRLGAGSYIKKPYTWIKLGQTVKAALEGGGR